MTVFKNKADYDQPVFYLPSKLIHHFRPSQRSQVSLMVMIVDFWKHQEPFWTHDTFLHIMAHSVFFIFFFSSFPLLELSRGLIQEIPSSKDSLLFFQDNLSLDNLSLYANDKQNDECIFLRARNISIKNNFVHRKAKKRK